MGREAQIPERRRVPAAGAGAIADGFLDERIAWPASG